MTAAPLTRMTTFLKLTKQREAQVEIPVHRGEEKEVLEKTNQSMDRAGRSEVTTHTSRAR